jgi:hypothetical protein
MNVKKGTGPQVSTPDFSTPDFTTMNSSSPDHYKGETFMLEKSD